MNNNIKLMVFDMAGTTINEDNLVYKTVQLVLNRNKVEVTLEEVLEYGAGKEKFTAIYDILTLKAYPLKEREEFAENLFGQFKAALSEAYSSNAVTSFSGTNQTFETLRKHSIKVVLNTGYNKQTANRLLELVGWELGRDVDALITADDVERGRPFPDMIIKAMKLTGVTSPDTVVKIGDSIIDIEEGKSAKCKYTVGLTSGAQTKTLLETANPDFIFDKIEDVLELI